MNNNDKEESLRDSMSLRDLLRIFLRRKWYFIIFFVAVLTAGLLFTFIKTPQYQSYSVIELKGIYYDENFYKYFPEESGELGVFAPELDTKELEGLLLREIAAGIRDDELLEEVLGSLDFDIDKDVLKQLINPLVDSGNRLVRIITNCDDAVGAYQINNFLVNTYIKNNKDEKSEIIDGLISEIEDRLASLESQYDEVNSEGGSSGDTAASLDSITAIITDLNKIKYNLDSNRDIYINNVELKEAPSIPSEAVNMNNLKSMLVTIFAALAVGLVAVYLPGIFTSFRK